MNPTVNELHQRYQNFRNNLIESKIDPNNQLSAREKIRKYRNYVSANTYAILMDQSQRLWQRIFTSIKDREVQRIIQKLMTIDRTLIGSLWEFSDGSQGLIYPSQEKTLMLLQSELIDTLERAGFTKNNQKGNGTVSEGDIEKIKKCLLVLSDYFLYRSNTPNLFYGTESLIFLGEQERMRRLLSELNISQKSAFYPDQSIINVASHVGTAEEKLCIAKREISDRGIISVSFEDRIPFYREKVASIRKGMVSYCEKYNIPLTREVDIRTINLAMELLKEDYDLIIGVLNSGTPIAAIHELCGKNVRYIEWHRGWKKKPVWRKVGKDTSRPQHEKVRRLLICEHDTASGSTLRAIQPMIEELNPESVDICYLLDFGSGTNRKNTESTGFYTNIFNPEDVTQLDFYKNMLKLQSVIRQWK